MTSYTVFHTFFGETDSSTILVISWILFGTSLNGFRCDWPTLIILLSWASFPGCNIVGLTSAAGFSLLNGFIFDWPITTLLSWVSCPGFNIVGLTSNCGFSPLNGCLFDWPIITLLSWVSWPGFDTAGLTSHGGFSPVVVTTGFWYPGFVTIGLIRGWGFSPLEGDVVSWDFFAPRRARVRRRRASTTRAFDSRIDLRCFSFSF